MSIIDRIDDNVTLAVTPEGVDQLNGKFYGKFPYPWRPKSLDCVADPDFGRVMLNQNIGDWKHQTVPSDPRIWVAGCGTNQAAITAVNFAGAQVRGSDVSVSSLELCAATAKELGCANLELRNESINQSDYHERFDYVICTGVIHHNADPEFTLRKLVRALKPSGILELMVYNRYHRILTSAFQKAVRLLSGTETAPDYQKEFSITKALVEDCPGDGLISQFAGGYRLSPDTEIADALIQPVENSYTVEVLEEMAVRCGLEMVAPAPNILDRGTGHVTWNMRFAQPAIQKIYDQLPDSRRWQVTNLLLCEKSPMLWFYFRRSDNPAPRQTEAQVCDSFLRTSFRRNAVTRRSFILTKENKFTQIKSALPYPGLPAQPQLRRIAEATAGGAPMSQVLESLGIPRDFATVNDLRLRLTTSASPFLRSGA